MIGRLRGVVGHLGGELVLLDVGGVGYEVAVPAQVLSRAEVGQELALWTQLLVREDALSLVGFGSLEERELYKLLRDVTGVGSKIALALLSHAGVEEIVTAVVQQQPKRLTVAPGVGKKLAERLVLELRDKLKAWAPAAARMAAGGLATPLAALEGDAALALLALGFEEDEVARALGQVGPQADEEATIRAALRLLSPF